jgi:antibiotic biosynthesis monooxygenase (ABM) superfamily enzyme
MAIVTWLGVYPLITLLLSVLGPLILGLPIPM